MRVLVYFLGILAISAILGGVLLFSAPTSVSEDVTTLSGVQIVTKDIDMDGLRDEITIASESAGKITLSAEENGFESVEIGSVRVEDRDGDKVPDTVVKGRAAVEEDNGEAHIDVDGDRAADIVVEQNEVRVDEDGDKKAEIIVFTDENADYFIKTDGGSAAIDIGRNGGINIEMNVTEDKANACIDIDEDGSCDVTGTIENWEIKDYKINYTDVANSVDAEVLKHVNDMNYLQNYVQKKFAPYVSAVTKVLTMEWNTEMPTVEANVTEPESEENIPVEENVTVEGNVTSAFEENAAQPVVEENVTGIPVEDILDEEAKNLVLTCKENIQGYYSAAEKEEDIRGFFSDVVDKETLWDAQREIYEKCDFVEQNVENISCFLAADGVPACDYTYSARMKCSWGEEAFTYRYRTACDEDGKIVQTFVLEVVK